ncbi:MAG TPA: hypothetical protein VFM53_10990 [Anaeromyxobacteraceae bacterium]|nr:hypothetical protein [Anaeromyxobacteraceae bacterium]
MQAAAADAPWRSDRNWDPAGEPGCLDRRARRALWWGVAATAVLLPWNVLAVLRPDLAPPLAVLVADLGPAALLARAAWLRRDWRRKGGARLRFDRFPFFLGEPFEAALLLDPDLPADGVVEVTLACRERRPLDGDGGAWREEEVYRATQVFLPAGETAVAFELPAPDRDLGTALTAPGARRWELRVSGRSGAPVEECFPVPVYAPPVDGAAAAG